MILLNRQQAEQDLVCSSGSANSLQAAYEAVADLINDARLTDDDRYAYNPLESCSLTRFKGYS